MKCTAKLAAISLCVGLCASAYPRQTAKQAPPSPAQPAVKATPKVMPKYVGKIVSVSAPDKSVTIADKSGSKTVTIGDSALIRLTKMVSVADIKEGECVQVSGTTSGDQSSIEARAINIIPETKARVMDRMVVGTAKVSGGTVRVAADGKTVEIKPAAKCSVTRVSDIKIDGIKEGMFAIANMGENGKTRAITVRETITPAAGKSSQKPNTEDGKGGTNSGAEKESHE